MLRGNFDLENGIVCRGCNNKFYLFYDEVAITPCFSAISYMPKKLIAIRCGNVVIVYSPEVSEVQERDYVLKEIATFKCCNDNAYLKVKLGESTYIIDKNVQISLCCCRAPLS